MVTNACEFLTNFSRSLRLPNNQFAEFLVNPLRMLRILTNAFANFANACERLTNEMTTQRMRGEPACQCFAASHLLARLYLEWPICFIRNGFASIRNVLFAFRMDECYQILTNVLRSLQMPCHQ